MINSVASRTFLDCGERKSGTVGASADVDAPAVSPQAMAAAKNGPLIHNGKFNLEAIFPQTQVLADLQKIGIPDELANSASEAILDTLNASDQNDAYKPNPNQTFAELKKSYDSENGFDPKDFAFNIAFLGYNGAVDNPSDISFRSLSDLVQFMPAIFSAKLDKNDKALDSLKDVLYGPNFFTTTPDPKLDEKGNEFKLELTIKLTGYVCDKLIEASRTSGRTDLVEKLKEMRETAIEAQRSYNEPQLA